MAEAPVQGKKLTKQQIIIGAIFLLLIIAVVWYYLSTKKPAATPTLTKPVAPKPNTGSSVTTPTTTTTSTPPPSPKVGGLFLPSVNPIILNGYAVAKYPNTPVYDEDFSPYANYNTGEVIGKYLGLYSDPFYAIVLASADNQKKYVSNATINIT